MDGYLLFATAVQLRIDAGMWYTNVRFSGWMTRGGERWSVCKFENGWQSWILTCIHTFILSCLQMCMPPIFEFKQHMVSVNSCV